MEHLITPAGYKPVLDLRETQVAIKEIKDFFQRELASDPCVRTAFCTAGIWSER